MVLWRVATDRCTEEAGGGIAARVIQQGMRGGDAGTWKHRVMRQPYETLVPGEKAGWWLQMKEERSRGAAIALLSSHWPPQRGRDGPANTSPGEGS